MDRTTLQNEILKKAVDYGNFRKLIARSALLPQGQVVKAVCLIFGVSRSRVITRLGGPADWIEARKALPVTDDEQLISGLITVMCDRDSYGYRRLWPVLRHQDVDGRRYQINHKRVYRIMRDRHLLLYRHSARPVSRRQSYAVEL